MSTGTGTPPARPVGTTRPAYERALHGAAIGVRKVGGLLSYYLLPKRKTLVRSVLFAALGLLPFVLILLIKKPQFIVPVLLLFGYIAHLFGLTEDVLKQLRWMRRMSGQGPIFWALARAKRKLVSLGRWQYGDGLDVIPEALTALGTSSRAAETATVKWIAPVSSDFSRHTYDVQVRATKLVEDAAASEAEASRVEEVDGDGNVVVAPNGPSVPNGDAAADDATPAAPEEKGWVSLVEGHTESELCLKPLVPGTAYEVRVRSRNSKGSSPWRVLAFTTKQKPLLMKESAGGEGPNYRWLQSLKDDSIQVILFGLPSHTKGRHLEVGFRPGALKVVSALDKQAPPLLDGQLYAAIVPDDCLWELKDADDGEGRELHMTLLKASTRKAAQTEAPLWPQLIKSHGEVDMSKVKRAEKTLEEIMAELHAADPDGMHKVEQMKKNL